MSKRANGEGSIWRRKDGRYVGATYAATNRGGRKRVYVYARTRAAAREKLTELQRGLDRGLTVSVENWTVEDYLKHWLENVVKPSRAPKTHQGYELAVRRHITPVIGRKRLKRLTVNDVRRVVQFATDKGLGTRMVQYVHAVLRNALENAMRDELVPRNVAKLVKVSTPAYEVGRGLTVVQAKTLLHKARDERLGAVFVLAVYLGFRRAEILGLRWEDVDLDQEWLQVNQTLQRVDGALQLLPPKSRKSRRTVPLPAACVEALRVHRVAQDRERLAMGERWQDHGLVFTSRVGNPLEPDNLRRNWFRVRDCLGSPPPRFHDLRHTCVSLLLAEGVPPHIVQQIAGHSALDVTMNIYAHASLQEKRDALGKLGQRLA